MARKRLIEIPRDPNRRDLLIFALGVIPLFFGIVGLILWKRFDLLPVAQVLWIIAAVLTCLSVVSQGFAKRLFIGWMIVFTPLGILIAYTVLAIIYFLVMTPIGWFLRLRGYDAMSRKLDRQASSYWIRRDPPPAKSRYFRQY